MRALWLLGVFLIGCGSAEPTAAPLAVAGSGSVGGSGAGDSGSGGALATGGSGSGGSSGTGSTGGSGGTEPIDAGRDRDAPKLDAQPDTREPDATECDGEIGESIQAMNRETPGRCFHPVGYPDEWCCDIGEPGSWLDYPIFTKPLTCGEEGEAYFSGSRGLTALPDGGAIDCRTSVHLQRREAVRRCCEG